MSAPKRLVTMADFHRYMQDQKIEMRARFFGNGSVLVGLFCACGSCEGAPVAVAVAAMNLIEAIRGALEQWERTPEAPPEALFEDVSGQDVRMPAVGARNN